MKKPFHPAGFTIAEMLIVITIIGILFSLGGNSYVKERQRFLFNDSLNAVVTLIKTARNHAVTSRAYRFEADGRPLIPEHGYGVRILRDAGTFELFANAGPGTPNQFDAGDGDVVQETYTLSAYANFEALLKPDPDQAGEFLSAGNEAVIIFKPPLAETFISNNGDPDDPANRIETLTLRLSNTNAPAGAPKRFISINRTAGFPELELR